MKNGVCASFEIQTSQMKFCRNDFMDLLTKPLLLKVLADITILCIQESRKKIGSKVVWNSHCGSQYLISKKQIIEMKIRLL